MRKQEFLKIVTDGKRYWVMRKDDPTKPLHEITLKAALDLTKEVVHFETDFWNERHKV